MAETPMFIADCPRCGERRMTFDILAAVNAIRDGQAVNDLFEAFCWCRHCLQTSIFVLFDVNGSESPMKFPGVAINFRYELRGVVRPRATSIECPEYVPDKIKVVFDEGAEVLAIGCWNAAGAMFRKVVDLVSKSRLPSPESEEPTKFVRGNLKARLSWLFEKGLLPKDVASLADCIREDGNDAVHDHPITEAEAEDLLDFTTQLLEGVYTQPGRLKAAAERRAARRGKEA